jgi:methionyl-tRNA formyltransferase
VSYAHKIDKAEAGIAWQAPAAVVERRLRAFDPFPGATAVLGGQPVKVWRGRVVPGSGVPGQVLLASDGRLVLACGEGALELLELQLAGGKRIAARDFLQRHPIAAGQDGATGAQGGTLGGR